MATSQACFKWMDDKFINQELKSSMDFRNWDWNAKKVKLYESVRKALAEICEDGPKASSPASVRENPYKDLEGVNEMGLTKF